MPLVEFKMRYFSYHSSEANSCNEDRGGIDLFSLHKSWLVT